MAFVLTIAGATNSGKTTLTKFIVSKAKEKGVKVISLSQDDYYFQKEMIKQVQSIEYENTLYWNYDEVEALDIQLLIKDVEEAKLQADLVIVEGNMLTEIASLMELSDKTIFATLSKDVCHQRRLKRDDYDPPDLIGYFEQIVWPQYLKIEELAKSVKDKIDFVSGDDINYEQLPSYATNIYNSLKLNVIRITDQKLDHDMHVNLVISPSCGAISTFIGTTRDTFKNKRVIDLEYECYTDMARKQLYNVCFETRKLYPSLHCIAISHRTNIVPITEASVVIATSSPHREHAIAGTSFAIDYLKETVPIWKKEKYADGSASWKQNCCQQKGT
uniref:Molybdopterin synthase n=1 Tax=Rhabditophanes sp. KR3021 TaxID=114890 RepID=A0AC35TGW3_9BILA